jgi:hypothetical protein
MLLADVAAAAGACSAPWSSVSSSSGVEFACSSSSGVEFACSGEGVLFAIRALSVSVHPQPLLSAEFATCSIPRQIAAVFAHHPHSVPGPKGVAAFVACALLTFGPSLSQMMHVLPC